MTATERCELTDLLVYSCACPAHRGGHAPGHEPVATVGQPIEATYAGGCARGCDGIEPGDQIARCWDRADGYAHVGPCPR